MLEHPAGAGNPTEHDPAAVREITRIEQAILDGDARILDEFGGLQKAVQRSVALKKWVLTRFVLKYTLTAQPEPSGAHEL